MIKMARQWMPTILAPSVVLLTFAFAACGGNEVTQEDVPLATAASETSASTSPSVDAAGATPESASPTATPAAETQDAARTSLDDYLLAVCGGQSELAAWEEACIIRLVNSE